MVKQNGSGIKTRFKKVFARGKKNITKKNNESIKNEKKSKKKIKEAAKALGKKRKGQQSNNKFTPEFINMIKEKGINNNSINNSNKNKKYYTKLILVDKDRNDIETYLNEEQNKNTFIIWKSNDFEEGLMNKNNKQKYMISMKIKKSAITKVQSNDNINIFNHNIIHKNKDTGKYSIVGLNSKDNNKRIQFESLYHIIKFTIKQGYQLLYIAYNDDNEETKKYLKNNENLLEFVGKWKKHPLYESLKKVLSSDTGSETFTPGEVGNIKNENIYYSIRETQAPTQQTLKKEGETEKEVTCKKCQDFMSMDKNKWCSEDNQKSKKKSKINKKWEPLPPTPPEKEMCDKCKKLMKGNKNCKKLNKKEESHYQNPVRVRPTINTRKTHNKQTYATLQKLGISRNTPVEGQYDVLNRKGNQATYATLKRIGTTHKTSTRNHTYNKLKIY